MEIQIIILSLVINAILSWLIAEFIGKSRHIGFGWSFALSFFSLIFIGFIATILSPSAKKEPTKGGKGYKTGAWICFIFGALNIIRPSPLIATFFILGIYLWELSNGAIVNRNPKFWFGALNGGITKGNYSRKKSSIKRKESNNTNNQNQYNSSNEFDSFTIKERKENLKNLYHKGILSESEYLDKMNALEQMELDAEIKNSKEYLQLKNLFNDGILSKHEFEIKVRTLKNKSRYKQSNYTTKLSYQGFSKAVEIYNLSLIQDNNKNLRTLKIRLQGILGISDYENNDKKFIRKNLDEYNTQLNKQNRLKVIEDVYMLPLERKDDNMVKKMSLDISNSLENRLIWKTKRDMYGTLSKGKNEYFPDLKSLLNFIQLN